MKLNLPAGVKLFGANIVPSIQNMIDGGGGGGADGQLGWIKQIQNWDWVGSIKPQIDYLIGNNVGCNCIRFSTQCQGVSGGYFSQSFFDACVMQVANYCNSKGVYFYYSPSRYDNGSMLNLPYQIVATQMSGTIKQLQTLPNVIGVDILQEAYFAISGGATTTAYLANLIAALKAQGVTLPLTCSSQETITSGGGGVTWLNSAVQYFDYLDCHIYYTASDNLFEFLLANNPGKDIIIGEFGYPQSQSADSRELNMQRGLSLGNSGNSSIRGAIVWGAYTQDSTSSNDWGMYDSSFTPRPERLRVMRRYTGGAISIANGIHGSGV